MRKPILLGVMGESQELLEEAGAGLVFLPENVDALLAGVDQMYQNRSLYNQCASNGYRYVKAHHDRPALARRYAGLLRQISGAALSADSLAQNE